MSAAASAEFNARRVSGFHDGATAQQIVDNYVDDSVVLAAGHKPVQHIGVDRLHACRYTLAAGGPGCDVTFIYVGGEIEMAVFDYFEPNGARAQRVIHGGLAAIVHKALAAYGPKSEATS